MWAQHSQRRYLSRGLDLTLYLIFRLNDLRFRIVIAANARETRVHVLGIKATTLNLPLSQHSGSIMGDNPVPILRNIWAKSSILFADSHLPKSLNGP